MKYKKVFFALLVLALKTYLHGSEPEKKSQRTLIQRFVICPQVNHLLRKGQLHDLVGAGRISIDVVERCGVAASVRHPKDQRTFMHAAAAAGNEALIRDLAKKGVSLSDEDKLGRVPHQYAKNKRTIDLMETMSHPDGSICECHLSSKIFEHA